MFTSLLFALPIIATLIANEPPQSKSGGRFETHEKKPIENQNVDIEKTLKHKIIIDSAMMGKYIEAYINTHNLTTPEKQKEHDKTIAKNAYDSVMTKVFAVATPATVGGTSLTYFNHLHKVEKKEVLEFTDKYLNKRLSKKATKVAVQAGEKTVLKHVLFFTMIGSFILEVEEWLLPGVDRYTRWAIALGIAIFLTILYHIQKRVPTKAKP